MRDARVHTQHVVHGDVPVQANQMDFQSDELLAFRRRFQVTLAPLQSPVQTCDGDVQSGDQSDGQIGGQIDDVCGAVNDGR